MLTFLAADIPTFDDMMSRAYGFHGEHLFLGLIWAVWVVLNLWIWQKTKATGNLLMLIGSGVLAFIDILAAFTWRGPGSWLSILALITLSAGFFLSVKPLVDAQLKALQDKLQAKLHAGKKDGGSPPPSA